MFRVNSLKGNRISVTIDASDVPVVNGEPDFGLADWPSDDEVSASASDLLGRSVVARFFDKGDSLLEGIYDVRDAKVA